MKNTKWLSLILTCNFALSFPIQAEVIRHDVDPKKYLVEIGPAALVDMRHEGHGLLIAPEWVITPAHVIFYDYKDQTITIGNKEREIETVIFHPGYAKPSKGLFKGYSGPSQAYLRGNHDVALVKLKKPVKDISPITLYQGTAEQGKHITFYGKGNTGNGLIGEQQKTKGTLRRAENIITAAQDQWIYYIFDQGDNALPLEAIQGNGDSGGPAIIHENGIDYLIGLASWDVYDGDLANFKQGYYGNEAALVRISYYADWMADVMTWDVEKRAANHHKIGK